MDSTSNYHGQFLAGLLALQQKAHMLRNFDRVAEINIYCDDLVRDVLRSAKSDTNRIEEARDHLLKQIDIYRAGLLMATNTLEVEERIQELAFEVAKFGNDWKNFLSGYCAGRSMIQVAQVRETELDQELTELSIEARKRAFRCMFMTFRPGDMNPNGVDQFVFGNEDPCQNEFTFQKRVSICQDSKFVKKHFNAHDIVVMPNGNIATADYDQFIKIWNGKDGTFVKKLSIAATSLACSGPDFLVIGTSKGSIEILSCTAERIVRSLSGHKYAVSALLVLPHGYLASCCVRGKLCIYHPHSNEPVFSHVDEAMEESTSPFGLLSNGHVVKCLTSARGSAIKVVDPHKCWLEVDMQIDVPFVKELAVLVNDNIAVSSGRSVQIFDLTQQVLVRSLENVDHRSNQCCLLTLPNGLLLAAYSNINARTETLVVWESISGERVFSTEIAEESRLVRLRLANDTMKVVALTEKKIKFWSVHVFLSSMEAYESDDSINNSI